MSSRAPVSKRLLAGSITAGMVLTTCVADPPTATKKQSMKLALKPLIETIRRPACPPKMVQIEDFCIDKFEAHLVVNGKTHPDNERPPTGKSYRAASALDVYPQAHISQIEAQQACETALKRLCTLREWFQACKGPKGLTYPYGHQEIPGRCNNRKPHLLTRFFGADPGQWTYKDFNNPDLNLEPGFLAMTGEYEGCVSAYGVFDMVGNLHEWVSDRVNHKIQKEASLSMPVSKKVRKNWGNGIFMGGFYSTAAEHGPGCHFITIGHEPGYHDYSTGFRCCTDSN